MGLWSVEDQWGRVIDVVLQYEVHRESVGPLLPSGEVINHNNDKYSGPNISLSQKSHVSLLSGLLMLPHRARMSDDRMKMLVFLACNSGIQTADDA